MGAAANRRSKANGIRARHETGTLPFTCGRPQVRQSNPDLSPQAVGFELLANEESGRQNRSDYDVELDPRWNRFLETLKDKGFFHVSRGALEHSALTLLS